MNVILVVTRAFGPHAKGDHLSDPATVAETLAGEYSGHVVRVLAPSANAASAPALSAPATTALEH